MPETNFYLQKEQSLKNPKLSHRDENRLFEIIQRRSAEQEQVAGLGNKELPAYKHKQEILAYIEQYKAIILGGETGSGKSTQLPQYLYEAGYDLAIMLVPRRVIADGLGDRIREEMSNQIEDFNAEETVGIVHGERSERHENNRILVMTPNTFIKMEQDLRVHFGGKKVAVVADEIHEANLFTEIATGVAAMAVQDNEGWRLIAASATHNSQTLQAPFQKLNGDGFVPQIAIEGRPFNVELQFDPEHTPMEAYAETGHFHEKTMIFTSGKKEIDYIIEETKNELEKRKAGSSQDIVFRKLHGELSGYELSHIDDPIPEGHRLVIVSSPAGMSGITIPGITRVITDGTINRQELDDDGVPGLRRDYLSRAEITQQIGRAGRDVPGGIGTVARPTSIIDDILRRKGESVDVPQMDYIDFESRAEHAPAEIYHTGLTRVVLSTAKPQYRFADLNHFIPHPVKSGQIKKAEEALSRLGALNKNDRATDVGVFMDKFPISPELSRGLYEVEKRHVQQQLARASFIAAALDVGGLQDFSEKDQTAWKRLVRMSTTDDYIAQLDLMMAVEQAAGKEELLYQFIDAYNLNPKRVERAQKGARKMLQLFEMNIENIIVTPPTPDEEQQLRDDFTSGLIDQVYREAGSAYRKKLYRNIHGNAESKRRNLSSRSVTELKAGQLVAGMPRWYEVWDKKAKAPQRFDIVEMTMPVDPVVVGRYAVANGLLTGRAVKPLMEGNRVVEREQKMFGSIAVAEPVVSTPREVISKEAQDLLVQRVLEAPGDAQYALRDVADELERYHQRVPDTIIRNLKRSDAPAEITKYDIKKNIEKFAETERDARDIDSLLRNYLYSQDIGIDQYFDDESLAKLRALSPDSILVGDEPVPVRYDNTQPYVTGLLKRQSNLLTKPMYLLDGREILLQIPVASGGTRRVSFGS